jgi:hypothetical protein
MNPPQVPLRKSAPRSSDQGLFLAEIWILVSAWCSLSGWLLSAMGSLNLPGFTVSFILGGILVFWWGKKGALRFPGFRISGFQRFKKRFRRPLPFVFLLTALLAFVGGAIYAPNNYDALTYRFPRILHWLAEGRWHWIDVQHSRMNYSGTGFEWLMVPLFVFTGSDRLFFLINTVSQLLLPGLVFSCFTALGINRRAAWQWMWLLPQGYCFALQAGSIGNDTFAVVYLLAAVVFARRAARRNSVRDLWVALLAAALMTGAKASSLPLLLPCFLAARLALFLLKKSMAVSLLAGVVAISISFLPVAVLNQIHSGDWTGDPTNSEKMKLQNPVAGLRGNGLEIASGNLQPSICPVASVWNNWTSHLLAKPAMQGLRGSYPRLGLQWGELSTEESAGVGVGLVVLFLLATAFMVRNWKQGWTGFCPTTGEWVVIGGYAALLVYMAKIGSESAPRLVAPYYPLIFAAPLLHPSMCLLVRKGWWKIAVLLAALSAVPAVILTPSRPLWPANTILSHLAAQHPESRLIKRAETVYAVYAARFDGLAPLKSHLPPNTGIVGLIGADDPQVSLWRPFGSRRVVDITTPGQLESGRNQARVIIASTTGLYEVFDKSAAELAREHNGRILYSRKLTLKVGRGAEEWFVIGLNARDEGL